MSSEKLGSIWRKWDLHVHTPFSSLNNGFGTNWDLYVKALFQKAIANDIYAIGITDYFTVDGYKKIKTEYLDDSEKMKSLLTDEEISRIKEIIILPNVEFRLDILITDKNNKTSRVNFHVIFSEEVPIYQIEENFLHNIDFIVEGQPQGLDQKRKLKVINLIELGQSLKKQHSKFTQSSLIVGMTNASVNSSQICELLDNNLFKDKYLLAIPSDEDLNRITWDGQGHNTRKNLIQKSDCLMTSNANSIEWGLGKKHKDVQSYIDEFKSIKPSIWGSDSHDFDELFHKNKDRYLWIKSSLSFDGLKQIKHEPKRVYIGIEPESKRHIDLNPSLYIERLSIKKTSNLPSNEEWFNNLDITLNPGLVAIIGNKGSGKSAIADIIGLCGNTKNVKNFSFLTDQRFNMPPERKSQYFEATMMWRDKIENKFSLSHKASEFENERVKYLPQSFLEKLCLGETEKELFENELRKIIFSRLPIEKKLGKSSLNEIITFKSEIHRQAIEQTKGELNLLNKRIIEFEAQNQSEYKQRIYEDINAVNKKLIALYEKMPVEPRSNLDKIKNTIKTDATQQLESQRVILESIELLINNIIQEKESIFIEVQELQNSIKFFKSFKIQTDRLISPQINLLKGYSIDIGDVFNYNVNTSPIEEILIFKKRRLEEINYLIKPNASFFNNYNDKIYLDPLEIEKPTSLYKIKQDIESYISDLQSELDLPAKEYQLYLSKYNTWQQEIDILNIEANLLEKRREYVDIILPQALASHYKDRVELLTNLFYQKQEIIKIYKELFEPVTSFKSEYHSQLKNYKIDFDANFSINQFIEKFESYINFGKSGSFFGRDQGLKKLNQILDSYDLNCVDGLISFLDDLIKNFLIDHRTEDFIPKSISSQLKQNVRIEDFYDFIFNLEYLNPKFQLKLGDKEIESLSPGEREALLLIFYLLLDNDKIPLIIDQPEENLDNQSIYSILVPFIQEAKERRQVILITHNPNLAVVCDADQIIHVKIDKYYKHTISCTTGSIENQSINQLLIEVLEGTFPAFDIRNQRYNITRSRMLFNYLT
ncbi:TrlF family AAA-like ATPase [Spirosoma pollinicola]|uniref:ATPase AAA-type core domain-containing protein n=1 Tax=Spirosoma pollinicola TaxID=2057025 RepID=A0A2K8YTD1_9BACT|nr:AAA family ATPase [Spirosoma pollinicola]AUD00886.1 hypothetical protein CWM47_03080 [Spirosoma pollinicola]